MTVRIAAIEDVIRLKTNTGRQKDEARRFSLLARQATVTSYKDGKPVP